MKSIDKKMDSPKPDTQAQNDATNGSRNLEIDESVLDDDKKEILKQVQSNPIVQDQASEEAKSDTDSLEKEDLFANPEPFEQDEIVEEYPMDTLYNKKRVPYIEKNNGSIMLTKNSDYAKAIVHYNKALFAIKLIVDDPNLGTAAAENFITN